jgi:uncharacterized protein
MATLTVRGRGVAFAQPDEVGVVLVASAYGDDAAKAYDEAAKRAGELGRLLDEFEVPHESRLTASVFVHDAEQFGGQERRGRFFASSRTTVRLGDPTLAERLLRETVQRGGVFEGPSWTVGPNHPARLESCSRAAEDARRRAEAYATALGEPLGALVSAAEPGTSVPARVASFGPLLESSMPVQAGDVDVVAAIDVTYELGRR